MEKEKHFNATVSNEEIKKADANKPKKQPAGEKVDKVEIINLISQLPVKERMDLIRDLQNVANTDADYFSTGRDGNTSHYDTLRDGYQKKAKEADNKEQPTETK